MRELPAFYHPIDCRVGDMPVIIYPARDISASDATKKAYGPREKDLQRHIAKLHTKHEHLRSGTFQIIFLWSLNHGRMADVWVFDEQAGDVHEANGALIRAHIFRGMTACAQTEGLASSVTMPILGAEAALRRDIVDLERFVHSPDIYPAIPGLPLTPRYDAE